MLLHSLSPPAAVRTVTVTASLCLIRLVPRRGSRCCSKKKRQKEKVTAARSRRKSEKTAREGCRRGRWHFTCDETTQLITALPRGSTRTTIGNRWRSIMWLRGNSCRVSAPHHPRADDTEWRSAFRFDPSSHFLPCVGWVCSQTWFHHHYATKVTFLSLSLMEWKRRLEKNSDLCLCHCIFGFSFSVEEFLVDAPLSFSLYFAFWPLDGDIRQFTRMRVQSGEVRPFDTGSFLLRVQCSGSRSWVTRLCVPLWRAHACNTSISLVHVSTQP